MAILVWDIADLFGFSFFFFVTKGDKLEVSVSTPLQCMISNLAPSPHRAWALQLALHQLLSLGVIVPMLVGKRFEVFFFFNFNSPKMKRVCITFWALST